jgi:hypothetical protein
MNTPARLLCTACLLACLVCPTRPAAAQNDVRVAVEPPAEAAPAQKSAAVRPPAKNAPVAMKIGADADSAAPGGQNRTGDGFKRDANGKFLNRDTAKNRRDYEMSTQSTEGIAIGKDENGDSVAGYTAPKKAQNAAGQQPAVNVEVRPIVPLRR